VVLDRYRPVADRILVPMAQGLLSVDPDLLTAGALVFAILAGLSYFWAGRLFSSVLFLGLAFLFVFGNALLDSLDGKVAKLTGKSSLRGDFLDHSLDRYADIFLLGGVTFSLYCRSWIGLLAILGVLMASYMGTQAQAVSRDRDYGGLLGRADRLVILLAMTLLQLVFDPGGRQFLGATWGGWDLRFTITEYAMLAFAILGQVTAIQRGRSTWRKLSVGP